MSRSSLRKGADSLIDPDRALGLDKRENECVLRGFERGKRSFGNCL